METELTTDEVNGIISHYYTALIEGIKDYCEKYDLYPWEIIITPEIQDGKLFLTYNYKGVSS